MKKSTGLIIIGALAAGGIALAMGKDSESSKKPKKKNNGKSSDTSPPVSLPPANVPPGLPPNPNEPPQWVMDIMQRGLASTDPDELDQMASELEKNGYPTEGSILRAKASTLRQHGGGGQQPATDEPPPGWSWGDIPGFTIPEGAWPPGVPQPPQPEAPQASMQQVADWGSQAATAWPPVSQ